MPPTVSRLSPREVSLVRISDLAYVHPALRTRITAALAAVNTAHHLDLVVYETLRRDVLQQEYFLRGASKQREAKNSSHGLGCAVDCVSAERGWNLTDAEWNAYGEAVEAQGLTWGGRWPGFDGGKGDRPHAQLGAIAGKPSDELIAAFEQGGLYAAWAHLGVAA